jgi:hypothetical protein
VFKVLVVVFILIVMIGPLSAQNGNVSGFVVDDSNGESLSGANIYFKDFSLGSVSNTSGYYVISDIPPGDYTLICSYVGYKDFRDEISLGKDQSIRLNIQLVPAFLETETVVVTADSERTALQLYRKDISKMNISPLEIKYFPAVVEADLLRTLQSLPGILPISDYSSEIYVRGGTSDQNLYLIDGADVYNPEHAFGLFSTFNTDAIKDIEVSKGGFSADYGGRLSSVLSVTNLDGNRKSFEGTSEISLLSAKATFQAPLWSFGSISASYRRTYAGETAKLFYDDIPDYYFYDGHLKAFFDINPENKISISFFNGKDDLNYNFNSTEPDAPFLHYDWGNTTGSLRWTHVFHPNFFSNFWLTVSKFESNFSITEANVEEQNDLFDVSFKGQAEYTPFRNLSTKFGFELKRLETIYQQDSPAGIVDVNRDRNLFTGYLSVIWRPTPDWNIEPGMRYNYFVTEKHFQDWAPRFAAKYRLTETINLKASTGIFYQYLNKIPRPFIADIWTTSDIHYDRSKAIHYIIGFQKEIADNISLEIETYYKEYQNLYSLKNYFLDFEPSAYDSRGRPIYTDTAGLFDRGDGNTRGIEFLFRKRYGIINGWIAYSLAKTEYIVDQINQENPFEPRHDRTHVINVVMNLDIKNSLRFLRSEGYKFDRAKWLLGMNFVYSSGQPITLTSSTYYSNSIPDQNYNQLFLYPTAINNFRLPAYSRLDLSLTYQHHYENWVLAPYIQIFNLGNRENVWFIQYDSEETEGKIVQTVDTFDMFPLLPTIGVRATF